MNSSIELPELYTDFSLRPEIVSQLEKYYILHWSGEYFSDLFYRSAGRFKHQEHYYQTVFQEKQMALALRAKIVAVSFRKLPKVSIGVALVKGFNKP